MCVYYMCTHVHLCSRVLGTGFHSHHNAGTFHRIKKDPFSVGESSRVGPIGSTYILTKTSAGAPSGLEPALEPQGRVSLCSKCSSTAQVDQITTGLRNAIQVLLKLYLWVPFITRFVRSQILEKRLHHLHRNCGVCVCVSCVFYWVYSPSVCPTVILYKIKCW